MASEWARQEVCRLKNRIGNEMFRGAQSNPEELLASALDSAHKQGRIEGLAMAAGIAETQRAARIVARSAELNFDRINELTNRAIGAVEVGSVIHARIEELQICNTETCGAKKRSP